MPGSAYGGKYEGIMGSNAFDPEFSMKNIGKEYYGKV